MFPNSNKLRILPHSPLPSTLHTSLVSAHSPSSRRIAASLQRDGMDADGVLSLARCLRKCKSTSELSFTAVSLLSKVRNNVQHITIAAPLLAPEVAGSSPYCSGTALGYTGTIGYSIGPLNQRLTRRSNALSHTTAKKSNIVAKAVFREPIPNVANERYYPSFHSNTWDDQSSLSLHLPAQLSVFEREHNEIGMEKPTSASLVEVPLAVCSVPSLVL